MSTSVLVHLVQFINWASGWFAIKRMADVDVCTVPTLPTWMFSIFLGVTSDKIYFLVYFKGILFFLLDLFKGI